MRVLIKLESIKRQPYIMEYHHYLQSFIYSMLKNSRYSNIHDKKGYRFFCFSNIFPASDLEQGDIRHLIISSPDEEFVRYIISILMEKKRSNEVIEIGRMSFTIKDASIRRVPLKKPFIFITGTPIIVRIPRKKYENYNIRPRYSYSYVYWRKEYPLELFIEQIEDNLRKKYTEFTGKDVGDESILQGLIFKKQVSMKIYMHSQKQVVIGSTWEFWFNSDTNKELLEFGLECGFGERNSLGFGFMNIKSL